jgi:tRNA-guanine family transglycosylase
MKILLTWYASPPDPFYWLWTRDLDGVLISLHSMRGRILDVVATRGLRRVLDVPSGNFMVVVDSLPFGLRDGLPGAQPALVQPQQMWVLYVQRILGADVLVHRDIPMVNVGSDPSLREKLLRRTLVNAEQALRIADKLGLDVMLVVQGWDLESYGRCARFYKDLGAKYVGVGSLVPRRGNTKFVEEVVSMVRSVLGGGVHLHLLGVSMPRAIVKLSRYVDSVDISTPIRAAVAREVIVASKGRVRRVHLSVVGERVYEIVREVNEELAERMEKARTLREFTRLLAVYNAITLIRWLKRRI